jgi:hypothetical protein
MAALIQAIAYLSGFAMFIMLLDSSGYVGPVRKVAFLVDHRASLSAAMVVTYIVTGICMVVLTAGLNERLKDGAGALMQVASPLGYLWAGLILASGMIALVGMEAVADLYGQDRERAAIVWQAVGIVQNGLGGGVEIVGGLWVLLISLAGRRAVALPGWLIYLGIMVGGAGVLTIVPGFTLAVEIFGVGMILWFSSVGLCLLLAKRPELPASQQPGLNR